MTTGKESAGSVVEGDSFCENGLVRGKNGLLVPAYVGSTLGYNHPGRMFLSKYFYPALSKTGIFPLCPFDSCSEFLDKEKLMGKEAIEGLERDYEEAVRLIKFEQLMPKSKIMIALLEGANVGRSLCAEICHFAENIGPVIGIRSEMSLSGSDKSEIDPGLRYFLYKGPYKGYYFCGEEAYSQAFGLLGRICNIIINGF